MSNTYSWRVRSLVTRDFPPDFNRVVVAISYDLTAWDPVEPGIQALVNGVRDLTVSAESLTAQAQFTAFTDLQESQVITWLMSTFDVQAMTDEITRVDLALLQLRTRMKPKYEPYLPWLAEDDPNNPYNDPVDYHTAGLPVTLADQWELAQAQQAEEARLRELANTQGQGLV